MKSKKLLSVLTASVLTIASAVPVFSSAMALAPDVNGDPQEIIREYFGEDAIVEYQKNSFFFTVISPEKMGRMVIYRPSLKLKLKKGSGEKDIDNYLNQNNILMSVYDNEKEDDSYILYKKGIFNDDDLSSVVSYLDNEIEILKRFEDVVSIELVNNIAVESTDEEQCYVIDPTIFMDFAPDSNKYPDFIEYEYTNLMDEKCKEYQMTSYDATKMYDTYTQLIEDYGKENVRFDFYWVCEGEIPSQEIGKNVYTAPITGDVSSNGTIDSADVVAISAYVGNPEVNYLNEQQIINGDVHNTGDGLTLSDALMIQQYLCGSVSEL